MKLPQRSFGSTGMTVSVLGLGTVKFGRNTGVKYPSGDGFPLPSDAEIESLLDLALSEGITLIDTAPAYGLAEERLGEMLGSRREHFFIITKTGEEFKNHKSQYDFSAEHTRMSVERSLLRLKTSYLDCVLVHSSPSDYEVITTTPVLETLARLKEEGKIKSFGVSVYSVQGGKKAVDMSDAVMVALSPGNTDLAEVIEYARIQNKAVLIKKGLESGHLHAPNSFSENIHFILNTAGVTSMVFGSLTKTNIQANCAAAFGTNV
jgi:aryl-alcohol dehydrogenase-like predicted oxidoreductase